MAQVAEHPSAAVALWSSQPSGAAFSPSPQVVVQAEGSSAQYQPCSIVQVAEQPLPAAVPPSSQPSSEAVSPSPQVDWHRTPSVGQ